MDNTKKGLIGAVTLLVIYGGAMTILPEDIDDTYYCSMTEQIAIFHRLSGTAKTGYYMEGDTEKSLACRDGRLYTAWVPLKQYVEEQGISWEDLIGDTSDPVEVTKVRGQQGEYLCEYNNEGVLETYSKCYKGGVFKAYVGELICPA